MNNLEQQSQSCQTDVSGSTFTSKPIWMDYYLNGFK